MPVATWNSWKLKEPELSSSAWRKRLKSWNIPLSPGLHRRPSRHRGARQAGEEAKEI